VDAIQWSDQKLWTFSFGTKVASVIRPELTSSAWSRDSTLLQGKQPTETPLKIWARSNYQIKSYEPFQQVLLSRRWYDPNGHRRRGVRSPRYSKENNLQKLLQNFRHDPTVGSNVIDLFTWHCGRVGGTSRMDIVGME
jgi:hypothetical protein